MNVWKCRSAQLEVVVGSSRAIQTDLAHRAGFAASGGARTGVVPDGVYTLRHGRPRFHAVAAPQRRELDALLERIVSRITRPLRQTSCRLRIWRMISLGGTRYG